MRMNNISFLFLAAVAIGCGSGKNQDRQGPPPVPVLVEPVVRGSISAYVSATGTVQPNRETTLSAVSSMMFSLGPIKGIGVEAGDHVREGQVLVEIDAGEIEARRMEGIARYQQALARCGELDALEAQRRAAAENARLDFERQSTLLAANATTRAEFDTARANLDQATAAYSSVAAQRLQVQAEGRAATATVRQMDWLIDHAILRAPFDGVVARKWAQEGDMAQPGAPILTLQDLSTVEIHLTVSEEQIGTVRMGAPVSMVVAAAHGPEVKGKVSRIEPAGNPVSRAFTVVVDLPNPEYRLLPGMFAHGTIEQTALEDALLVPRRSVQEEGNLRFVWLVRDGKAIQIPVEIGILEGETRQIRSGLDEGNLVVTRGAQNLTAGVSVRVTNAQEVTR